MQKKRKKILIALIVSAAIFLPVLLFAFFFWYQPHRWLDKLQNNYLLQHRNILQIKNVQAGAFNKFILHDVRLGSRRKSLFISPRAELLLDNDLRGKFGDLPIRKLVLYDCKLTVDAKKRNIFINDILLADAISELNKLPSVPDGKILTLEIAAQLAFGKKAASSELKLEIQKVDNKISIAGKWNDIKNKNISGSWQTFIDLTDDHISVKLHDHINEIFMQEILLRTGVSAKVTALLDKGLINGSGNFSGSFRKLRIKDFIYTGKVEKPTLSFYKHKLNNVASFILKIQKSPEKVSFEIPELKLAGKTEALLKNITIHSAKTTTFSADSNLQQLAADLLAQSLNLPIIINTAKYERVSGEWNTKLDTWSFTRKSTERPDGLQQFSAGAMTAAFKLEKFDFSVQGKGSAGTLNKEIKFKNLEIYRNSDQKQVQSADGSFTLKTIFGSSERPDQHTLGINCKDFSAVTALGIVEIPRFSANTEIRNKPDEQLDIFTSISGSSYKHVFKSFLLNSVDWRGIFRLAVDRKNDLCIIKSLDFKSGKIKLEANKKEYTLPNAEIKLDGVLKANRFTSGNMNFQTDRISSGATVIEHSKLALVFDSENKSAEKLKGFISCRKGVFPISGNWFISRIVNGEAAFASSEFLAVPSKIRLKADWLDWQTADFSGTFQNSKWLMRKEKDKALNCTVDFDYLKFTSQNEKFGSGQIGKSSLSSNISRRDNGKLAKLNLMGILSQLSWIKDDHHIGSENVQCTLKYDDQSATMLNGDITWENTNILSAHITASTPRLKSSFTAKNLNDISGDIDFAAGTITDSAGNIELRKTQISLPLRIASSQAAFQHKSGKITVQDIFFRQQREGSFSGTIHHFMRLPSSVTDTMTHQLALEGKMQAVKFDKPLTLNGYWMLPPEKSSIKWNFSMPESKLLQPVMLANYLKIPLSGAALKGNFTLDGNIEISSGKPPESALKINSINSSWQFGDLAAEGVTGTGVLDLFDKKYSFMPQDLTIAKILWSDLELQDNELNISMSSEGKLQASNWHGSWLGGKFRSVQIPPVNINNFTSVPSMRFALSDMPIGKFLNKFGVNCLFGDALLNGDIQLNINNNKLLVDNSSLSFKSPAGKLLQLKLEDPAAIRMPDRQFRDFTIAILNAMKCYQGNINFSTTADEIAMLLKAEGTPAAPVPFVYQGRNAKTPFRPAKPGESGFAGEIELNVNLKLHPGSPGA